jgi:hypothetical protein
MIALFQDIKTIQHSMVSQWFKITCRNIDQNWSLLRHPIRFCYWDFHHELFLKICFNYIIASLKLYLRLKLSAEKQTIKFYSECTFCLWLVNNIKSVNLVAETTKFLQIVYSNINDKSLPLVVQLFDTLAGLESLIYCTWGKHTNHYTTCEVRVNIQSDLSKF